MKHKATLGVMLAFAAAAPAVVVPQLVAQAQAQDQAEYPDVPRGHWAYNAIDKLSRAGIIEGLPSGNYAGNKPMTRYEFAVAIARLLDKGIQGPPGPPGPKGDKGDTGTGGGTATIPDLSGYALKSDLPNMANYMTRQEINDLIAALRREFADELARLGVRVDQAERRLTDIENRVNKPPRLTITPSILWRGGTASYITQGPTPGIGGFGADPTNAQFAPNTHGGRNLVNGNSRFGPLTPGVVPLPGEALPAKPSLFFEQSRTARTNAKYSYTDFEVRLTDRISDRLSLNAAIRALGSTQEDPWAGEQVDDGGFFGLGGSSTGSGIYVREANAVVDLSDRRPLGIRGLNAIIGRQRTKNALGLLYDNDLAPTDQANISFNIGPFGINWFNGTTNNQVFAGARNPYASTGSVRYLGLNTGGNGALVGFPGAPGQVFPEDNENLLHVGFNLFRIGGQPVSLGVSRLWDGYQNQTGDSLDLSVPLFNRTIGFEWVQGRQYASGQPTDGDNRPRAYFITAPILRTKFIDLNAAYGNADD